MEIHQNLQKGAGAFWAIRLDQISRAEYLNNCQSPLRTHKFKILPRSSSGNQCPWNSSPLFEWGRILLTSLGTINPHSISISFSSLPRRALQRDNTSLVMELDSATGSHHHGSPFLEDHQLRLNGQLTQARYSLILLFLPRRSLKAKP